MRVRGEETGGGLDYVTKLILMGIENKKVKSENKEGSEKRRD